MDEIVWVITFSEWLHYDLTYWRSNKSFLYHQVAPCDQNLFFFLFPSNQFTFHGTTLRVWFIKSCTNVLHNCVNANQKLPNLIKSANCWHLSHSKMVHNLYVSSFLWILEQILSKDKFLKIPRLFKKNLFKRILRMEDRKCFKFCSKLNN